MDYKSTESVSTIEDLPEVGKGRWATYFPYGFWYEWKHLAVLAIPIMITSTINYIQPLISLYFLGHLGKSELAAGGLAISIYHVAGVSIIFGLLTASETLFSQTFGGSNKFRLGVQVQRAFVIVTCCSLPCVAIYVVIEPILLATNQPPLIAKYTGNYMLGLIPGLFCIALYEIATKYIQAQNKVYPPLFGSLAGGVVNTIAHYLFVFHTDYGFVGSAISQSLGLITQSGVILAYIFFSRIYRTTWDAIHVELWHDWDVWFRLAIPGMLMSGLEWWVCESGSLLSGLRGEHALAVQTILNNVESLMYCTCPMGFCIATTIRIGQFLGANKTEGPRATASVAFITIAFFAIIESVILSLTRFHIPLIFTTDEVIIDMTATGMISIACFVFFDAFGAICSGVIRGVGMQRTGAIVCIVCMYLIGGPMGLSLLMLTELSVSGFWWGMMVGMGLEVIIYIILIKRINWNQMCRKAAKRTEIKFINDPTRQIALKEMGEDDESIQDGSMDSSEETKACTTTIVWTRAALIMFCSSTVLIALACRFFIDWKSHFQSYCLLSNGSVLPINSANTSETTDHCLRILP